MGSKLDTDNSHLLSGPLHVAFDVTNKCMARCLHCFNRSGNELPRNELSDEEFLNVIDQIAEVKPFSICYCGGEPLLRFDSLVEATGRLKQAGVVNIAMVSNGWLWTQEKANKLSDAGHSMVQISLDGSTPETHERLRGIKGIYEKALAAMEMVNNTKMNLSVAFSPTSFNVHQFSEVVEMVTRFEKLTSIRIQPLMPMGKATESKDILPSEQQYREIVYYIEEFNTQRRGKFPIIEWGDPIDHLRRFEQLDFKQNSFIEIKSDGLLSLSGYLPIKIGNLRKHTLKEYWDAGLGKAWKLPIIRELSNSILSVGDMSGENSNTPAVYFDQDIIIDIIEDKPFSGIHKWTLQSVLSRHSPQPLEEAVN